MIHGLISVQGKEPNRASPAELKAVNTLKCCNKTHQL